VTVAERGLVESLREELAAVDPPRRCCRSAEIAGLAGSFPRRRRTVTRVILRLRGRAALHAGGSTDPTIVVARSGATRAGMARSRGGAAAAASVGAASIGATSVGAASIGAAPRAIERTVKLSDNLPGADVPEFEWKKAAEHCRVAYLRGLFLAHGSLSLASGRTHLEFVLPEEEARVLCERLGQMGLPATWRLRRGRGVVTWKSGETVGQFLRVVGGGSALLELESRLVSRALRGDLNRFINAESANLQRAVEAAARQLDAIATLAADGRLAEQPYVVRLVADARRQIPEATLTELAERLELNRSAVQRALERVERLALHPDDGAGKRARSEVPSGGVSTAASSAAAVAVGSAGRRGSASRTIRAGRGV
jgi:DNA-binding transcriptional regulator WhiA